MRYSVYDYDRKVYNYFDGPGPAGTHATAPPVSSGRSELGATVEQASWKVPPGAKRVGSGELPQGRIASMGGLGDIMIGGSSLGRVGVFAVVGYLLWRHFR